VVVVVVVVVEVVLVVEVVEICSFNSPVFWNWYGGEKEESQENNSI